MNFLILLIFTIFAACSANIDKLKEDRSLIDVGKNVNLLFSPNVFEAYSYKLKSMAEVVNNPKFKKDRPTVVYVHGWLEDGEFEESVMAVRSAYRNRGDHNILVLDWSKYSHWNVPVPYKSSISKLKTICEMLAEQMEQIRKSDCNCYKNFYLVGHSLGGQCVGLVGRTLKRISNGQFVIPRIYALDPAGPGFEFKKLVGIKGFDSITKDDATYVQVIHTNGGKLGVEKAVGHSDFFVNGGIKQPGCSKDMCHHKNSWVYYQQSVREEGTFLARKCDSYYDFLNGNCDNNEIQYMGYSSNNTLPMGTYYLRTHPSKFGTSLGEDGLRNTKFIIYNQDGSTSSGTVPFSYEPKIIDNINNERLKNLQSTL